MSDHGANSGEGATVLPRCFIDVAIDGEMLGRIVFELFSNVCPKTCENFRALCTGEKSSSQHQLHYKGSPFHRIVKNFMIQGGDFINGNGTGGESIYGHIFSDENFTLKHDRDFLLSMANRGPNSNGSQFFILTKPAPHLDGIHVVFGRVVNADGKRIVKLIEAEKVDENYRPFRNVTVVNSGELVLLKKSKPAKRKKHASKSSASKSEKSGSESEEEQKNKKEEKKKKSKKEKTEKKHKRHKSSNEKKAEKPEEDDFVCSVRPDEIPPVPSNRFLQRYSDRSVPTAISLFSTSGPPPLPPTRKEVASAARVIKGRGSFRFTRSPSPDRSDRSRRRSDTFGRMRWDYRANEESDEDVPAHWREAQQKSIPLSVYEKRMKGRKERELVQAEREKLLAEQMRRQEQISLAKQLEEIDNDAERQGRRRRRESGSSASARSRSGDRTVHSGRRDRNDERSAHRSPPQRPNRRNNESSSRGDQRATDKKSQSKADDKKQTSVYSDDSASNASSDDKSRRNRRRDRKESSSAIRESLSRNSTRSQSTSPDNHPEDYRSRRAHRVDRDSESRRRSESKSRSRSRSSSSSDRRPGDARASSQSSDRSSTSRSRSRSRSWRRETKKR